MKRQLKPMPGSSNSQDLAFSLGSLPRQWAGGEDLGNVERPVRVHSTLRATKAG